MGLSNRLEKILIIDFGSQFTQLIARRVREFNVYSEIISHKNSEQHSFSSLSTTNRGVDDLVYDDLLRRLRDFFCFGK